MKTQELFGFQYVSYHFDYDFQVYIAFPTKVCLP